MANHALDCGCVLTDDGRIWCPTCVGPRSALAGDVGIRQLQIEITDWADKVFPDRTINGTIAKFVDDELPEFQKRPTDAGEYADLLILILDIAGQQGIDCARAVQNKMRINRQRTWTKKDGGKYQHE